MKTLWITLISLMLFTIACEDKKQEEDAGYDTYTTINVKSPDVAEYFTFATNSGTTTSGGDYDVKFYAIQWQPAEGAPTIYDPRLAVGENASIAVVNAESLDDATEIPDASAFVEGFNTEESNWYYTTDSHLVMPHDYVYVVNTADGKYPAFEIMSYYDDIGVSGVFVIQWTYLNN